MFLSPLRAEGTLEWLSPPAAAAVPVGADEVDDADSTKSSLESDSVS